MLVENLCCQVAAGGGQRTAQYQRYCEGGWIFFMTLQLQKPEGSAVLEKVQVESVFTDLGNGDFYTGKGWKLVTYRTRKKAPVPPRVFLVAESVQLYI